MTLIALLEPVAVSPLVFAVLTGVAVVTGTVDAIAGGGGLIMMPTLIATGLPLHLVLGTNKLQSILGTSVATARFHRAGMLSFRRGLPLAMLSLGGSVAGAALIARIDAHVLGLIVPLLLIGVAIYTVRSRRMDDRDAPPRLSARGYAPVAGAIGFYDGFFGPGAGQFYAASLVSLRGMGLTRAMGLTKLLNVASNLGSLLVFAAGGHVLWLLGLTMGVGAMTGALIGSRLATRHGAAVIRPLLVTVSLALTAKLIWGWFAA
ncbi:TSUP family transporter [Novosphingobium sp.]|uniref:TSUP family transporter n=1 Tax=Novosphingobium sp. TaxID=1874826 RepID=UPI00334155A8